MAGPPGSGPCECTPGPRRSRPAAPVGPTRAAYAGVMRRLARRVLLLAAAVLAAGLVVVVLVRADENDGVSAPGDDGSGAATAWPLRGTPVDGGDAGRPALAVK